ncbi:uncharacterized protein LOC115630541 [Scaptodrosophila lebanonensis]|uniref:Uncharacterized protein LOC115630541 n=1 Tax=Drosophila lebanonensis TaxID=7225 RepID=A0A6J2U756_DROLE|nr:uncharacterized protein LOC115630541 [Scaptodrosophila lebanonensis]
MDNLEATRALCEILKIPLPDIPTNGQHVDAGSDCDSKSRLQQMLNADANEFVPYCKRESDAEDEDLLNLNALKRHFEAFDEYKEPEKSALVVSEVADTLKSKQLTLPWKGFPKTLRTERTNRNTVVNGTHIAPTKKDAQSTDSTMKRARKDKTATDKDIQGNAKDNDNENAPLPLPTKKKYEADEKKREHERKVALEALKLVEQRRMREPLVPAIRGNILPSSKLQRPVVHLTRSPVRFTPEERERVDRLRVLKRERIEFVLREMKKEREQQKSRKNPPGRDRNAKAGEKVGEPHPRSEEVEALLPIPKRNISSKVDIPDEPKHESIVPPKRYICLQRSKPEQVVVPAAKPLLPARRYIPTTKEWDEQCKAKQLLAEAKALTKSTMVTNKENKENEFVHAPNQLMAHTKLKEHKLDQAEQPKRELLQCVSNVGRASSIQYQQDEMHEELVLSGNGNEYILRRRRTYGTGFRAPNTSMEEYSLEVAPGEMRRGNLTHARNLVRAFPNWVPSPVPTPVGTGVAAHSSPELTAKMLHKNNNVIRYNIEQLLQMEPEPADMKKPNFAEFLHKFGFIYE